jgi:GNAT superfamily N-acetyltransferase
MLEVREARDGELSIAAGLRQEMSLETGGNFDGLRPGWRAGFCEFFSAKQRAGEGQLFLAFDGEAAVGMTIVTILDDYRRYAFGTPSAFVNAVFVQPPYRRRGIARSLMRAAIAWARGRGCTRVRLRSSDEGRALYESLGFRAGREMEIDL